MTPFRISVGETQWFEMTCSVCYSSKVTAGIEECGAWMRPGHREKFFEFFSRDKMSLMVWQTNRNIHKSSKFTHRRAYVWCDERSATVKLYWPSELFGFIQWESGRKNWDSSNWHDTKNVDTEPNALAIIHQHRHECVCHCCFVIIIKRISGYGGVTYITICCDGKQAIATSSNMQG